MTPAEQNCIILIVLTAILLILAHVRHRRGGGRFVALLAIVTILTANYAMYAAIRDGGGWGFLAEQGSRSASTRTRETNQSGAGGGGDARGGAATHANRGGGAGAAADIEISGDEHPGLVRVANDAALDVADWLAAKFQRTGNDAIAPQLHSYSDCVECPEMVPVIPGNLVIGAETSSDVAGIGAAAPRMMRVWPGFLVSRTEIKIGHLQAAGISPVRNFECNVPTFDDASAASCITDSEISTYLDWLKQKTGKRYRLPDSAEWEFVARANASARRPALDMGGGLAELVADCWSAATPAVLISSSVLTLASDLAAPRRCSHRIVKDGTTDEDARWRRFASRRALAAGTASPRVGFRVIRDVDVTASRR